MTFIGFNSDHRRENPSDATMTSIYLEKRLPARNQQRFYRITITPTLFGSWAVVREWGRIHHPGTVRETWFATEVEALNASAKLAHQKVRCGYHCLHTPKASNTLL